MAISMVYDYNFHTSTRLGLITILANPFHFSQRWGFIGQYVRACKHMGAHS